MPTTGKHITIPKWVAILGLVGSILGIFGTIGGFVLYISSMKQESAILSVKYDNIASKYDGLTTEVQKVGDKVVVLSEEVIKLKTLNLKTIKRVSAQEQTFKSLSLEAKAFSFAPPIPELRAIKASTPLPPLPKPKFLDINKDLICKKEYDFFNPNDFFNVNGLK